MKLSSTRPVLLSIMLIMCSFFIKLSAQVTIGSDQVPAKAALLDLKSQPADANNVTSKTGGLGLPRVQLKSKSTLEPFIPNDDNFQSNVDKIKDLHIGLTVYNLTNNLSIETDLDKRFRE